MSSTSTLIAVCGAGVHHVRGVNDGRKPHDEQYQLESEAVHETPDSPVSVEQRLLRVIHQALEDGAETQYRGKPANVGLYFGTTEDGGIDIQSLLGQASKQYDLQGPSSSARGPSALCQNLHKAYVSLHKGKANAAIVVEVTRDQDGISASAIYMQTLDNAIARKSPVLAILAVKESTPAGISTYEMKFALAAIIQVFLHLNPHDLTAGTKAFVSSLKGHKNQEGQIDGTLVFTGRSGTHPTNDESPAISHNFIFSKPEYHFSEATISSKRGNLREKKTEQETQLAEIWAQVLNVSFESISCDSSFLQLGGTSISALKLISAAREKGLAITLRDVFIYPRIRGMAKAACEPILESSEVSSLEPFSMLNDATESTIDDLRQACGLTDDQIIEDAFPCTPYQSHVMERAVEEAQSCISTYAYELPGNQSIAFLEKAWTQALALCPNLRTKIIRLNDQYLQFVVNSSTPLQAVQVDDVDVEPLAQSFQEEANAELTLGTAICQPRLIQTKDQKAYLVLAVHDAIHDAWSMMLVHAVLDRVFLGLSVPNHPATLASLVKYGVNIDTAAAEGFWSRELHGAKETRIPYEVPKDFKPSANISQTRNLIKMNASMPKSHHPTITPSTVWRVAWGIVLGRLASSNDVCFDALSSGRQLDVTDLDVMSGPTLASVPVRLALDEDQEVARILQDAQDRALTSMSYEHSGLQSIAQLGENAVDAATFSSLFVLHSLPDIELETRVRALDSGEFGIDWKREAMKKYRGHPFIIEISLKGQRTELLATHDPAIITRQQAMDLCHKLRYVVRQLMERSFDAKVLREISTDGSWDEEETVSVQSQSDWQSDEDQPVSSRPELVLFSAHNKASLKEQVTLHHDFYQSGRVNASDLAYTRALRREHKDFRAFSIMQNGHLISTSAPRKVNGQQSRTIVVFSGQGAQWNGMGRELVFEDPEFADDIDLMDAALRKLAAPPTWSLKEEFMKHVADDQEAKESATQADLAQALSAALQLALFRRFQRVNVKPDFVIGHSSGEIAAAYAAGLLTLQAAIATAYYYGLTASKSGHDGAMVAVGMGSEEVSKYLCDGTVIACENSPDSTTIAGDEEAVDRVAAAVKATKSDVSVHRSKVNVAYHSHHMDHISGDFLRLLEEERLSTLDQPCDQRPTFVSSVHGAVVDSSDKIGPSYWALNMTSPVRFQSALASVVKDSASSSPDIVLEIGPHSALAAPVRQIYTSIDRPFGYVSSQVRSQNSLSSFLSAVGRLWQESLVGDLKPLVDYGNAVAGLPPYAWVDDIAGEGPDHAWNFPGELGASDIKARIEVVPMETDMERKIQHMWSRLLDLQPEFISRHDSFLQMGGDSISAIRLSDMASKEGVVISTGDIFARPELYRMAAIASTDRIHAADAEPLSLLPSSILAEAQEVARKRCGLTQGQTIKDMFPCTALQAGFLTLAEKQPGSYIMRQAYRLADGVDVDRFKDAWERTVIACDNLRTRIFLVGGSTIQALITDDVTWDSTHGHDLSSFMKESRKTQMTYGSRLSRYALLKNTDGHNYFILTLHHAIYDGWSLRLNLDILDKFYATEAVPPLPLFANFIRHIGNLDENKTKDFWTSYLSGARKADFPPTPAKDSQLHNTRVMHKRIQSLEFPQMSFTKATLLRAAWAVVMGAYSNTDDVCFGVTNSGRQAPVEGLTTMAGVTVTTLPFRVRLDGNKTLFNLLQDVQSGTIQMIKHEQFGLQNISKLGQEMREACDFTSLLVVQPGHLTQISEAKPSNVLAIDRNDSDEDELWKGYFTYPLVLQAVLRDGYIDLSFTYDADILQAGQVEATSHQMEHVLAQIETHNEKLVNSVSVTSTWDVEQTSLMKGEAPEVVDMCFHEMFAEQVHLHPDNPAIDAWDGMLTYKQLYEAANRLAHLLVRAPYSVGPEHLVHVCFDKSVWHFVSILAINSAGAAWVPLDPSHPHRRNMMVVEQTKARLVLTSEARAASCAELGLESIKVNHALDIELVLKFGSQVLPPKVSVKPSNAAYILFTSGSTGVPKGLLMDHSALCTSQVNIIRRLRMPSRVRMLQFAAFVFDFSIGEIIGPLLRGACICVPSEEARMNDLAGFVREKAVTWTYLTPSLVRTLRPEDFPSLELLLLGGEAVGQDVFDAWFGKLSLWNAWGPAEDCCCSSLHEWTSVDESPMKVGKPVGTYCWIVDPDDPHSLAPVGVSGEVVLQGPTLFRHYLADEKRTREVTIDSDLPSWASNDNERNWGRFYKTGDICKWNPDGTMTFVSRKDSQIKIRGYRVELSEIEHHVRKFLPDVKQVVVDTVILGTSARPQLAAYFCFSNDSQVVKKVETIEKHMFLPISEDLLSQLSTLLGQLSVTLPSYMVPALFIPCRFMPFITSTKADRNTLKAESIKLEQESISMYSLQDSQKRPPETEMEKRLQSIWATILGLVTDSIGRDDSFLHLGGDSISAIQLVDIARKAGMQLSVKGIFNDPRLSAVAAIIEVIDDDIQADTQVAAPYSLLSGNLNSSDINDGLKRYSGTDLQASDAFPCTQFQEGLMALSVKHPGSYIAKFAYRLAQDVKVEAFIEAWDEAVALCANLRTRILHMDGATVQVTLASDGGWDSTFEQGLSSTMKAAKSVEMTYGSKLTRYSLTQDEDGYSFVLLLHHAIFDGWSLGIIMNTLFRCYNSMELPSLNPYSAFISYVHEMDRATAEEYWSTELQGAQPASFPAAQRHSNSKETIVTKVLSKAMARPATTRGSITPATMLRAAWALLLARYSNSDDVTFGVSVSGRQASLAGLSNILGPTVTTVPVRVKIDGKQSVKAFLDTVQQQALDMVPYEQFGLQNIAKLNEEAKEVCNFSSLAVVQPFQQMGLNDATSNTLLLPAEDESNSIEEFMQGYFNYPLIMESVLFDDKVEVRLIYDSELLGQTQIEAIAHQYEHALHSMAVDQDQSLQQISMTSNWDLDKINSINIHIPEVVDACIHGMFEQQAASRPGASAVEAWDGRFTYSELDAAANRLANHLIDEHGVHVGDVIHLCFEKSAWYIVSLLAVNKAGAAWAPLDSSHPAQRWQQILLQTGARLCLASASSAAACTGFVSSVIEVGIKLDQALERQSPAFSIAPKVAISPDDAAYILFTSGSTGIPKGVVIGHRAVCSSFTGIWNRLCMTVDTRMLQFASYVFDMSIAEICVLLLGATLCVPSEDARINNLGKFVDDFTVNSAVLTPAFARTLEPADVPSLKLMLLGGEAVGQDVVDRWAGRVRLFNGWGPAETTMCNMIHEYKSQNKGAANVIGSNVGSCVWLVDPKNPYELAPFGTVGEAVVQGPTLLHEYLADPEKTDAAVVHALPAWIPRRLERHWDRFYKTGDLCKYRVDGSMEFIGRKDTQIKIRGFRIELGDIEHAIWEALEGVEQVVVDVHNKDQVAAYLCFSSATKVLDLSDHSDMLLPLDEAFSRRIAELKSLLSVRLPQYMVPTIYVPVNYIPLVTSQKTDRKALLSITAALPAEMLASYMLANVEKEEPIGERELMMQALWADILNVSSDLIGRNDSFLHLGGDSLAAIRLVTKAREHHGAQLRVATIFRDPRLGRVAASMSYGESILISAEPWSLVSADKGHRASLIATVRSQCSLKTDDVIEDIYPASPFQEGLMALASKQPGSYIARFSIPLDENGVERERFKQAWLQTLQRCHVLRTWIVIHGDVTVQAVIQQEAVEWNTNGLDDLRMEHGTPLCCFAFRGPHRFELALHHSIFDGWSSRLIVRTLTESYYGSDPSPLYPYSNFIKFSNSIDMTNATEYWRSELGGATKATFPRVQATPSLKSESVSRKISTPASSPDGVTIATVLRAAWALLLSQYNDGISDVTFGAAVAGRQAPVEGIHDIVGPTLSTVPIRVKFQDCSVIEYLQGVQQQAAEMMPFEQVGLQNISKLGPDAKQACDFSTLLVVQPRALFNDSGASKPLISLEDGGDGQGTDFSGYFSYPLVWQCFVSDEGIQLLAIFDSNVLTRKHIDIMAEQYSHVVNQLWNADGYDVRLKGVSLCSPNDVQLARSFNPTELVVIPSTFHSLIEEQATLHPDAPAICAWDEELSYSELNAAAERLAWSLVYELDLRIAIEERVVVCFEKSAFFYIAILAINKVGGAWVPLDPGHPRSRHDEVVRQAGARIALTSSCCQGQCQGLVESVIEVSQDRQEALETKTKELHLPLANIQVQPNNIA